MTRAVYCIVLSSNYYYYYYYYQFLFLRYNELKGIESVTKSEVCHSAALY